MAERIRFYGPVQGMVRIDDARPAGYPEARELAELIRREGCPGCPRLVGQGSACVGVGWVGLQTAYLYEHQGRAVHAGGGDNCRLIGREVEVPERLVIKKN